MLNVHSAVTRFNDGNLSMSFDDALVIVNQQAAIAGTLEAIEPKYRILEYFTREEIERVHSQEKALLERRILAAEELIRKNGGKTNNTIIVRKQQALIEELKKQLEYYTGEQNEQ